MKKLTFLSFFLKTWIFSGFISNNRYTADLYWYINKLYHQKITSAMACLYSLHFNVNICTVMNYIFIIVIILNIFSERKTKIGFHDLILYVCMYVCFNLPNFIAWKACIKVKCLCLPTLFLKLFPTFNVFSLKANKISLLEKNNWICE